MKGQKVGFLTEQKLVSPTRIVLDDIKTVMKLNSFTMPSRQAVFFCQEANVVEKIPYNSPAFHTAHRLASLWGSTLRLTVRLIVYTWLLKFLQAMVQP